MKLFLFSTLLCCIWALSCTSTSTDDDQAISFYKIVGSYQGISFMETTYPDGQVAVSDSISNTLKVVIYSPQSISIYDEKSIFGNMILTVSEKYIENGHQMFKFTKSGEAIESLIYDDTDESIQFYTTSSVLTKTIKVWFISN